MLCMKKIHLFCAFLFFTLMGFINFGLHYFTNIHVHFDLFFWIWLVFFCVLIVIIYANKTIVIATILSGIVFIAANIYFLLAQNIPREIKIENSKFYAEIERNEYRIINKSLIFNQTIAWKNSTAFSSDNTKLGIDFINRIKEVSDTDNELILEFQNNLKKDTLQKVSIWNKIH